MTPDHASKLPERAHGEAMLQAVSRHVAPIFWSLGSADGTGRILNNGTIFLVDVGRGPFALTANHVYEGYLAARAEHPRVDSFVLPMSCDGVRHTRLPFDLESRLIARLYDPDIATFRVTPEEAERLRIGVVTRWPPLVPAAGQAVAFAGFPGHRRRSVGPCDLSFAVYPCLTVATRVNERHISCQFNTEQAAGTQFRTGGMSGGPLFTFADPEDPSSWRLGGVIALGSPGLDILRACPVDRLQPDGSLRKMGSYPGLPSEAFLPAEASGEGGGEGGRGLTPISNSGSV